MHNFSLEIYSVQCTEVLQFKKMLLKFEHGHPPPTQASSHLSLTLLGSSSPSSAFLLFLAEQFLRLAKLSSSIGHCLGSPEECFSHFLVHQKAPSAERSYSQKSLLMVVSGRSKARLESVTINSNNQ